MPEKQATEFAIEGQCPVCGGKLKLGVVKYKCERCNIHWTAHYRFSGYGVIDLNEIPPKKFYPAAPTEEVPVKEKPPKIKATNKSVRDLPQTAIIEGDEIRVLSKRGRKTVSEYRIRMDVWEETLSEPNPDYAKAELIRKLTPHYDEEPGGVGQAQRIRDAQRMAIEYAIKNGKPVEYVNVDKPRRTA